MIRILRILSIYLQIYSHGLVTIFYHYNIPALRTKCANTMQAILSTASNSELCVKVSALF